VVAEESGDPYLPVRPHSRFAEANALEDWAGTEAHAIDVDDFSLAWTKKLDEARNDRWLSSPLPTRKERPSRQLDFATTSNESSSSSEAERKAQWACSAASASAFVS
jgi:Protein of unknown function (DUF2750)